jgi:hypothetical protein
MSIHNGFRAWALVSALVLAASSVACSISRSVSDSIESSSDSSSSVSSSSSPESNETKYRKDVESYTKAFVVSGGSDSTFMAGIGDLAQKRGITDWEANDNTWLGIGRGLGGTKIDKVQLDVYERNWTGGDAAKIKLIQKGFDQVR